MSILLLNLIVLVTMLKVSVNNEYQTHPKIIKIKVILSHFRANA